MSKEYHFKCNVCQSKKFAIILDFNKKPIVHHLKTKTSIKNKSYDFSIASCKDCSHLQIYKNINPKILYKNYLTPSAWKNNWHIDLLLKKMVSIFNLNKNDKILEIGSNDGYFIDRFLKNNFKNIYGIEPSKDVFKISKDKGHKVINDFFSHNIIKKKTNSNIKFDLIFFRHVLEHVSNLKSFFSQINQSLKGAGNLMIEVPDHDMNYENYDYTFWEEHTNYFNKDILKFLLYKNNFRIIHHETSLYSGKAIMLFCEKHSNIKNNFTFNSNK